MNTSRIYTQFVAVVVVTGFLGLFPWLQYPARGQTQRGTDTGQSMETLSPVEVEAPEENQRRTSARTGTTSDGFGADRPTPQGFAGSDFPLTPGEVVSPTRTATNISRVNSAVSVIENRGVESIGYRGLPDMLQGTVGLYTSGFSATPFDSAPVIRGFSNEHTNRVSVLYDGRSLNVPRQEANFMFVFPELIDRVEVLRGDGTIQFGNKAIAGAVNVIPKRPRQNPGVFGGAEAGSWQSDKEWLGYNYVKGPIAAGVFLGRYYTEGFRVYQGNGMDEEFVPRPGPWALYNFQGSFNWKITPRLTFDVSQLVSDQRSANASYIFRPKWERRDTRSMEIFESWGFSYSPVWDGPTETWDAVTTGRLIYDGDRLGQLELIASYRRLFRRSSGISWNGLWDNRWIDQGMSLQYTRDDNLLDFFNNVLTWGIDWYDGQFGRESRSFDSGSGVLSHSGEQSGYRESLSYYVLNTATLWDRVTFGFGWRFENYDLKDLFANDSSRNVTNAQRLGRTKSATQWSVGLITDRDLGSSIYYRHARTYRFPGFDDMCNYYIAWYGGPPFWPLEPEEGTLDEVGIRHWLTRSIYLGLTYYEMDMDNEILFGDDNLGNSRNINAPGVSHQGLEFEGLVRITPRWTLKGNWTRQEALVRSEIYPTMAPQTTEDKELYQTPRDMGNVALMYNNQDWGFSADIKYHYVGSRYRINDVFNIAEPLPAVKWGDIAFEQKILGDEASIYFGINNVSDLQYALWGTRSAPSLWGITTEAAWYPNEGRTYYGGVKSSLDFNRMKLPTTADLERMQRRLYGSLNDGINSFTGMGSWIRNVLPFPRLSRR
ncbi:MAG: TonB-dependent receptor [Pseudomonadota bacterium]